MGFSVNITMNQGFYTKTNPDIFRKAENDTIKSITIEAEEECRRECPVRTGNLRDSHYTVFEEDTGKVLNTAEYANTVIYGNDTRSPNDYPQRALNNISTMFEELFIQSLSQEGVIGL